MNRTEFAEKVAKDTASTKVSSKAWTDAVIDCLADAIMTENEVALRGFGTFEHIVRKPKVGRNSKTGERVDIPAKMIVKFTPCQKIEDSVATELTGYEDKK